MATKIVTRQGGSVKSICRLCFMEQEHVQSIFEGDHAHLEEWIKDLIPLKLVNVPNAPASLCLECKSILEDFESFREMCLTNDHVFKEMFLQNDGQPKKMPESLDFPTLREIKVERSCQELEMMDPDANEECSIASNDPRVENNDITEELEDIKIEIEEHTLDCEEKVDVQTNEPLKCKKKSYKYELVQCNVCSKSFTSKDQLRWHRRHHKKTHFCSYCNKSFINTYTLNNHIQTHTGEYSFQCKQCDKGFILSNHLKQHMQDKHSGINVYSCDSCDMTYTSSNSLNVHKHRKHKRRS